SGAGADADGSGLGGGVLVLLQATSGMQESRAMVMMWRGFIGKSFGQADFEVGRCLGVSLPSMARHCRLRRVCPGIHGRLAPCVFAAIHGETSLASESPARPSMAGRSAGRAAVPRKRPASPLVPPA